MRLPRSLRRRSRIVSVDLSTMEATEARERAEAQWQRVHQITEQHRELRRRNHFAATVGKALEGRTP